MPEKQNISLLLVDDDPVFTAIFSKYARNQGVNLDVINEVSNLHDLAQKPYDGLIVDYDLGCINGVELAHYLSRHGAEQSREQKLPVLLISQTPREAELKSLYGDSMRSFFVCKSEGLPNIFSLARSMVKEPIAAPEPSSEPALAKKSTAETQKKPWFLGS